MKEVLPLMNKHLILTTVAIMSVLMLALSFAFAPRYSASAASHKVSTTPVATPSFSVSTTQISTTGCPVVQLPLGGYSVCTFTLTFSNISHRVNWTSSVQAKNCYGTCTPYYDLALLPAQGTVNFSGTYRLQIIGPTDCQPSYTTGTITIKALGMQKTVNYMCDNISG